MALRKGHVEQIRERGVEIDFLIDFRIGWGSPVFLLVSNLVIMPSISTGEVGFIMNGWEFGFFRYLR